MNAWSHPMRDTDRVAIPPVSVVVESPFVAPEVE